ncbi:hypothetical protein B0H11DRAFT_1918937 [Mycena galericulata]|nr:hypothetical protein B0H11DRAFT_1918937 [Mycena galericulata]
MLTTLSEKEETHMSGNGYKPQVWASVVTKVNEANPEAPQLKKIFGLYLFVQKFSGSEWDDEAKDFVKTYGDDECSQCFKSPCPYRIDLDSLYHGNINKATGDNVEHLEKRKRTVRKENSNIIVSNATAPTPNASSTTHTPRRPLDPITTNLWTSKFFKDKTLLPYDPRGREQNIFESVSYCERHLGWKVLQFSRHSMFQPESTVLYM